MRCRSPCKELQECTTLGHKISSPLNLAKFDRFERASNLTELLFSCQNKISLVLTLLQNFCMCTFGWCGWLS